MLKYSMRCTVREAITTARSSKRNATTVTVPGQKPVGHSYAVTRATGAQSTGL
jgi:hypothetical protein